VPADEANQLGLVTRLVADGRLDETALELAREAAAGPTFAFGIAKKMFKSMRTPTLETALDAEAWAQGLALMTEDHKEGGVPSRKSASPSSRLNDCFIIDSGSTGDTAYRSLVVTRLRFSAILPGRHVPRPAALRGKHPGMRALGVQSG
jgi:hypothetical protein